MFIENKKSGLFLAKKVGSKKLLIQIKSLHISDNDIRILTKKECEYIYISQGYIKFIENIYHEALLQKVIYMSLLFINYRIVNDFIANNWEITGSVSLLWKWRKIYNWMTLIFPKKFIYNSNNIEGSRIPEEEVMKIIENKKYKYKIKNEIQEVDNSLKSWDFIQDKFLFNNIHIKKLYHILTKDLLQETGIKYPRGFKKVINVVNNSMTTSPENVSWEIIKLVQDYKDGKKYTFPLQAAFDFHLKYEQIHPFENGNGRTGRFIMNKILLQNNLFPMIVFTENKKAYFNAIASCTSGNKKKYYKFMLEQYKKTLDEIGIS